MPVRLACVLCALTPLVCGGQPGDAAALLRHSESWVRERMAQMLAVDDAYIWHDILGGRAIHQNSATKPPTEPIRGNFHTQQQAFFASVKMDVYDLGGRTETRHLDDAGDLLHWVLNNGYDAEKRQFYLNYNMRSEEWKKDFFPEFNMMSVSAMLRYNTYRPSPELVAAAENVLARIVETDAFKPGKPKNLYGSGYIALKMLDAYDATREERFLDWAETVVTLADEAMWDDEFGGWFYAGTKGGAVPEHTAKFTHTNADMMQACFRLYLRGRAGDAVYHALEALEFLAAHSRSADGGWYRHTNRDGSDATLPPIVGDGADTEPGTPCVYDRMAQMIVACCLAYRVTEEPKYVRWVDETLDRMEKTHLTKYPVGVNYGYINAGDYQNTWCHLWGLKAMIEMVELWVEQ